MAKRDQGVPYLLKCLSGGDVQTIVQEAFSDVCKDLQELINSYYDIDWPILAAVLILAGTALKSDLTPDGQDLADDFMHVAKAVHWMSEERTGSGGYPFQNGG